MPPTSFTGLQRRRKTSRRVGLTDAFARLCITVGGLGTIAAVGLVCCFLLYVVVPLLLTGSLETGTAVAAPVSTPSTQPLCQGVDPYLQLSWQLHDDGVVRVIALADGSILAQARAFAKASSQRIQAHDNLIAHAGDDGVVTWLRLAFTTQSVPTAPQGVFPGLPIGAGARLGQSWVERTPGGFRVHEFSVTPAEPIALGSTPVLLVDIVSQSDGTTIAAITADGRLHLRTLLREVNPITDEVRTSSTTAVLELNAIGADSPPDRLLLTGAADNVYLVWDDGRMLRLDTRNREEPRLAEQLRLLPADGSRITECCFLIGGNTLLIGDDRGRIRSGFLTKAAGARGSDGGQFDIAHDFPGPDAAVTSLAASARSRVFAAAYADQSVRIFHGTSQKEVARSVLPGGLAAALLTLAPKEDALVAATGAALHRLPLSTGHPEFTLAAVATPVWYEGHERPSHSWQSTSGTDDFEPKFGLWPLVFGTIKATFYCLLFGVPLALLAAIYTSEFMHPRSRARVKPLIELMASLPSVVLGFLAALLFAPIVEQLLPTLLACAFAVPLVWLIGSQAVALLPSTARLRVSRHRLLFVAACLPPGLWLASVGGQLIETTLFGGSITGWLAASDSSNRSGSAFGGWLFLFLPVAAFGMAFAAGRTRILAAHPMGGCLRLAIGVGAALASACALAGLATMLGFDLRGNLFGTYVQRNALVVGFVMGFAVIPIVYTIAEDALSAVPEHLRAASLGAGATPWQTAVRVIGPTAMSGIFSAVMIGLGRAVGETMIVLMAAGNTPVLEVSPFNGFRTLSANIAVELPEAVVGSSHYRMLYLAAFVLFVMTFALNTVAEVVRQRFRRRAFQL